ncbi:MAG: hypothetical protein N5P05_003632 [Chroococcopsis gigantea SAG 12.99]|jgi:hypothetical protein|nr:hypothetical protein [Chroococcopsis gigantea SAG 12.99]
MNNWFLPLIESPPARNGEADFQKILNISYPAIISWQGRISGMKSSRHLLTAIKLLPEKILTPQKEFISPRLLDLSVTHDIICLRKNLDNIHEVERLYEFQLAATDEIAISLVNFLANCMNACCPKDFPYLTGGQHRDYWFRLATIELKYLDADARIWEVF